MREATFRSSTRETPPERKEITFRMNEGPAYVRVREFSEGQVVEIRKRRREGGWEKQDEKEQRLGWSS